MSDIINTAIAAAKTAGDFLLANFGKISHIESKGDRNLATNLDREAEKIIVERIKAQFPHHGILAEEGGKQNTNSEYLWIIDPLDGTHNYIRNIALFGVSIGIVHKEKFVGGVIYMPVEDELYVGQEAGGAYKNDKKISVSQHANLKDCSIAFDSSIRYSPQVMLKTLGVLAKEVFNIRMFGSSARTLSYIAEGKLDCAVEFHDRPWDFAGAVCIITEAQGTLTNLKGKPLSHTTVGYIASNGIIHDAIREIVIDNL
ncbi:MAG: inositol monophosphatase [Candidatus Omnitrophota bacterium]|nr:MAG: inositol monophosphatase [Candidatus Omnitrophota bacterium]